MAQAIEDHSLPKSAIKTYHVRCASGGLAMIRHDSRQDPIRVCVNTQDRSKPLRCQVMPKSELQAKLVSVAAAACE
jgi:hypothetical protein